jgi:hypothetical protein
MGALVLAACVFGPAARGLPTYQSRFCSPAALLFPVRIEIDPDREPPVWGTRTDSGARLDLLWPPDYSLREHGTDGLAVVNGEGLVIATDGTVLESLGGASGGSGAIELCPVDL